MRKEILEKITENNSLIKVNLAGMGINDDEILEIIETIKQIKPTTSIIDLDNNNNITDKGAIILSEQLRNYEKVTELSLQFNDIGREGAINLFSLKKYFSALDILFHGNKIKNVREMDKIERLARQEIPSRF